MWLLRQVFPMLSTWNRLLTDGVCMTNKFTATNGIIAQHQDLSVGRPLLMLSIKIWWSHTSYVKRVLIKINTNTKKIKRLKAELAHKIGNGEEISDQDKAKTRSVGGINLMDLGPILFGDLNEDSYANQDSPIARSFTKKQILEAHRKLGFQPYTTKQFWDGSS